MAGSYQDWQHISATNQARQHNGNVYNNNSNYYTIRQKRSDDTLKESELNQALLKAAAEGQTRRMEVLISRGANSDHVDAAGLTTLHYACFGGFEDTVDALLAKDVDINAYSRWYGSPLVLAAYKGRQNIVETLLEPQRRTNIHARGGLLGSALHATAHSGDANIADMLIKRGLAAELVKLVDRHTITDIPELCVPSGKIDLVECSTLMLASWRGHIDLVKSVLDNSLNLDASGRYFEPRADPEDFLTTDWSSEVPAGSLTALFIAARYGQAEIVKLLLRNGANPDTPDGRGSTPLMQAAVKGHVKCIAALLDHNATIRPDVNLRNVYGRTAVMQAVSAGHIECVKLLLKQSPDLSLDSHPSNFSSVHHAASKGDDDMVCALVEAGADIDGKDVYGESPLFWAANSGHLSTVKLLIALGASTKSSDRAVKTATKHARRGHDQNYQDIAATLKSARKSRPSSSAGKDNASLSSQGA